jgi:hypothetical protein
MDPGSMSWVKRPGLRWGGSCLAPYGWHVVKPIARPLEEGVELGVGYVIQVRVKGF